MTTAGSGQPAAADILAAAPCGIAVADGTGLLVDANPCLCKWLGHPREALVGKLRFQDLLTMGGRIFHQTHLAPLLRIQGSFAEVKLEMRRADGRTMPVMVNVSETQVEGRTLTFIALFVAEDRDKYERELLVQRRRAEELSVRLAEDERLLAQERADAQTRAEAAEQMMGIVSHDLRNPLSVIHLSALLLERAGGTVNREVLQRIHRAVQRAEALIADLLDFTQARLGQGLKVRPVPVDAHTVVRDAVQELCAAFPGCTIAHTANGEGQCIADPERLVQAVGNLVGNAAAYGKDAGAITVRTSREEDRLAIRVHNWGTPIPPGLASRLFEPMVRGTAEGGARSVGLGLYIVQEIARAHGGTVSVTSSESEGTEFTLLVPAGT